MANKSEIDQKVFQAVRNNDVETLRELMVFLSKVGLHWLDCRLNKSGDNPLHVAAREGHQIVVRFLCEEWKCPNLSLEISNFNGKKCLHEAAQSSHPDVVQYLVKQGAEIDSLKCADWTPLMLACTKTGKDAAKTVQILLENGANAALRNKDGWTPLHVAVREGDTDVISLLLAFNSDVNTSSYNGRTPLHIAALHGQEKAMELLLKVNTCPLHQLDSCGLSPVLEAVRGGYIEVVQQLLRAGASLSQVDAMGLSCIHLAAQTSHTHMIKFLVQDYGISANLISPGTGLSPLHCAARADQPSAVKQLLHLGANPNVEDGRKRSVADSAYGDHRDEILHLLRSFNCPS